MLTNDKNYTIFLQRHSHKGKTQVVQCAMSVLKPEHAEQSIALHDRVAHGLGSDIFIPSDKEEIKRCLSKDGFTIGIWHEEKLVCARTLKTDADWVNEGLEDMGEPSDPKHSTVLTDYMVVDKEFLGNNVQFLTYFISEILVSMGKDRIVSTVAPKNVFSLQNIMRCGFHITGLKSLYGGNLRYVTVKKLRETLPIWTNRHYTINIRNIAEQKRIIAEGNVGYKLIHKIGGFAMLFAPMCEKQPSETQGHSHRPMIPML